MALPSLTFGNSTTTREVWDAFWELSTYLQSIASTCLDFGVDKDFTSSSTNLKPSKIRFEAPTGGHDHGPIGGGKTLSAYALEKRHFDLNALGILWQDLWSAGKPEEKYVLISGNINISAVSSIKHRYWAKLVTSYPWTPLPAGTTYTATTYTTTYSCAVDVQAVLDTTWAQFATGYSVLCLLVQPTSSDTLSADGSVGYRNQAMVQKHATNGWIVGVSGIDANGAPTHVPNNINYLAVVKFLGDLPPNAT